MQDDRAVPSIDRVEWISFESRMRRRRLSRCLLRADLALEDGFRDDARSALDEAREIDPESADLAALDARLAELERRHPEPAAEVAPPPAAIPVQPEVSPRRGGVAIVAVLALAAVLVIVAVPRFTPELQGLPGRSSRSTAVTPPAPSEVPTPAPAPTKRRRDLQIVRDTVIARLRPPGLPPQIASPSPFLSAQGSGGVPTDADPRAGDAGQGARTLAADPRTDPRVDDTAAAARPERPDVVAALDVRTPAADSRPIAPERDLRSSLEPAPALAAPPPAPPAPLTPAEPASARLDRAVPTLGRADDSSVVRKVLARYEGAYSALDADAASRVWPTVDRSKLARAFDGLSRQQVSLGECDVTVSGPAARATCLGSASWTPKVGGGRRTEERRWSFELRKSGEEWLIERASAR
jgi:hypothetical protein